VSIYQELVAANVSIGYEGPNLYAQVNPKSEAIVERYPFKRDVQRQPGKINRDLVADYFIIPNAFEPYWHGGVKKKEKFG
jgi:hypothetical protein